MNAEPSNPDHYRGSFLCDAHCHLQDERLDLERVMPRAFQAGVRRFLCCGCEEADWPAVRDLAGRYAEILPSFGLHPWYVARASAAWQRTLETLLRSVVSGVGEIGLDHAIRERNDDAQEAAFLAQLRLARALERPVSVHCRKAWGRLLDLLRQEGGVRHGGVIHSYSGPPELVPELEALGFWISFSGTLTRSNNRRGHASLMAVSPDRLLLETDAPSNSHYDSLQSLSQPAADATKLWRAKGMADLPPRLQRCDSCGQAVRQAFLPVIRTVGGHNANCWNEPANLVAVVEAAARLLQESPATLAARVWNNFHRCFKIFPENRLT